MKIDLKYQALLLEALEDLMYKLSLQVSALKGSTSKEFKDLVKKQAMIEEMQHIISVGKD